MQSKIKYNRHYFNSAGKRVDINVYQCTKNKLFFKKGMAANY